MQENTILYILVEKGVEIFCCLQKQFCNNMLSRIVLENNSLRCENLRSLSWYCRSRNSKKRKEDQNTSQHPEYIEENKNESNDFNDRKMVRI